MDTADWNPESQRRRDKFLSESRTDPNAKHGDRTRYDDRGLYTTLAHELFHGIQGAYDQKYKSMRYCDASKEDLESGHIAPVLEGGAFAAGAYLASKNIKWPDRPDLFAKSDNRKLLGGFPYPYAFFKPGDAAYFTNSFWRFLAEKYGGLGYMKHLLQQPLKVNTVYGRIQWLAEGLRSYTPIKISKHWLYTLFPAAITEIYSYSPNRYKGAKERDWIYWLSNREDCQGPLKLAPASNTKKLDLNPLPPISARCVDIEWEQFDEEVELDIEAITSKTVADQLHIGLAKLTTDGEAQYCYDWSRKGGGEAGKASCLYEKPFVQTGPKPEKLAKKWMTEREAFQKAGSARLVIANIAPPPTEEHPGTVEAKDVELRIGIRHTKSNDGKKLQPASATPTVRTKSFPLLGEIGQPPFGVPPERELALVASAVPFMPQAGAPSQDDTRELLYGIQKGKPLDMKELPNMFSFQISESGGKEYSVSPGIPGDRYNLGFTGPIRGVVGLNDPDNQTALISSLFCAANNDGPVPIGKILRSDELELRVHIKTDLCRMDPMAMAAGATDYSPVVDHLDAEIVLPFGWRYFAESAPQDIVTPGIKIYMARYHDRMGSVPGLQSITGMFSGGGSGGASGGAGGGGGGSGGGGPAGSQGCSEPYVWTGTCTCCCAELARMSDLKNREKELTPAEQEESGALPFCALSCTQQYIECRTNKTN